MVRWANESKIKINYNIYKYVDMKEHQNITYNKQNYTYKNNTYNNNNDNKKSDNDKSDKNNEQSNTKDKYDCYYIETELKYTHAIFIKILKKLINNIYDNNIINQLINKHEHINSGYCIRTSTCCGDCKFCNGYSTNRKYNPYNFRINY